MSDSNYTDGVVIAHPGTVIVKYAYFSDTDFSGAVDGGDISTVLGNLSLVTPGLADMGLSWILGDMDFSGLVDGGDLSLVLGYLGTGSGGTNNEPL